VLANFPVLVFVKDVMLHAGDCCLAHTAQKHGNTEDKGTELVGLKKAVHEAVYAQRKPVYVGPYLYGVEFFAAW
jgi:hypothetical protein